MQRQSRMMREVMRDRGGLAPRAGTLLAVGLLAAALGACSILPHSWRPGSQTGAEVKNPPGGDQAYPKVGEVPERPKRDESADTRREIAKGLVADRDAAHYADQALRGGTEPSAAPPPPPVAGALQALPPDVTGAVDSQMKVADNKTETRKPGFFARLFGAKDESAPAPSSDTAPLPAHPAGAVDVKQAPSTN